MKKVLLLGGAIMVMLSSCTMQKCVYNKGFYVDWFDAPSFKKSEKMKIQEEKEILAEMSVGTSPVLATAEIETASVSEVQVAPAMEAVKHTSMATPKVALKNMQAPVQSIMASNVSKKEIKDAVKEIKKAVKLESTGGSLPTWALYLLCFIIPPVAVGFATDWDINKVLINVLWCLLCGIPGLIHALIIVSRS